VIDNAIEAIGKLNDKERLSRLKERMIEVTNRVSSINANEVKEYIELKMN